MDIVLTEECQKQIRIIQELAECNKDFAALYTRIALYVKALQKANNIDELEFGTNDRHINNRLSGNQSDIATRDLCPVSVDTITKRLGDSLATREVWLRLMRYKSIADKYGA